MTDSWTPDATTPQAACLPALADEGDHRLYRDSADAGRLCVDALEPRLRSVAARAAAESAGRAARPVTVALGPSEGGLRRVHGRYSEHRSVPLTWSAGPFFAWARKAGGVFLIDRGVTHRGRCHEAHLAGRQPDGVELTPAIAAAELVHWGRLHGATVRATVSPGAFEAVFRAVRVGRRAAWTATLGDALGAVLRDLERRDLVRITVASARLPLRALEELRELVVMEWARRLAGSQPLSLPAARISGLIHDADLDLTIDWRDGDRVPLRTVRTLRYESLAADSASILAYGMSVARDLRVAGA